MRALLSGCLGVLALTASAFGADVEIQRRWAAVPPTIDGVVSAGEWNAARITPLTHGQLRTMNDSSFLYVLLDVTDDTVNDPTHGSGPADFFVLAFDVDQNFAVTPHVDLDYDACQDSRSFIKSYYLGGGTFTGCQNTDPATQGTPGFGPSPASATPHRVWEFRLNFAEIGVDPTTWSTSAGSVPHVRVNVATVSANPAFSSAEPSSSLFPDFTGSLFQIDLASLPMFPPGSTGPTFFGVGLVPSTYIDAQGFATINVPGYAYTALDAPFGGNLNVFGNWLGLRAAGARSYRVMYSKDGGPATPLLQTWTNFRFNNGTATWDPVTFGPDANGRYPIPNSGLFTLWYLPNLIVSWQSGLFGDGTYTLSLEVFNALGNPLPAPAENSLTLFIDNTAPVPTINRVLYDGDEVCTCGIVTQGDPGHGFTFDISYTDAHGALDGVSLVGIYGNNASAGVFSTQYSPSHVDEDGPNRWNGESNVIVGAPFHAPAPCAYSFILGLSSRVQNGYSRLFGPQYHVSLTILQGTGAGGIDTCLGGGSLTGTLSSGSAASSVLPDAFSLRVFGGKSLMDASPEAAGAPRPMGQQ